ncbi:ChrR family anti-sigma-E factor [Thalassotalea ponticola]|uniref:ChrR family anti-sigma-E factor n=1 Tax=Thalassotalea ponticola TaxID=1523392 RepID=UPI0025B3A2B7|nr:ChrR family anti-sigma-E factor [Thalassotalea ponticola]MDN3651932.1 ChrR family anti-sigma-E factor [Thalassotalea ponticola]
MIKHHPSNELLQAFVSGELPASMSAAVAMHTQMCQCCQQAVNAQTDVNAHRLFEQDKATKQGAFESQGTFGTDIANSTSDMAADLDMMAMIDEITLSDDIAVDVQQAVKTIDLGGKTVELPRVLTNMPMGNATRLGKLTRARMDLEEGDIHASLLHIDAGGEVPEHTHKGYEVTLLLEGSFSDEMGSYEKGDFILLDAEHKHHPKTEDGCLCFTVANDALHFTQGLNKLLNPFASYLY